MSRIRTVRKAQKIPHSNHHIVKSSATGGMRQMRCRGCQGMMVPQRAPDGQETFACPSCGARSTSRPM